MIHHSITRSRSKGVKIKRIVQVALLFGVALWLVYQIKHSYDEDPKKLSTGVGDLNFGRKGKPGTENSVSVDSNGSDTAEQHEQKGGDNDSAKFEISLTDADPDVNTEEDEKHVDNVDDDSNDKSNDDETRKGNADGKEVLQLPSQMDDHHSFGKIEDGTGGTNSNGQTKMSPGNQIEENDDPSENVSEHGNNAKSESGVSSNESPDAPAVRSQEGAENANSVSDAQNNASSTEYEVRNDSKQDSENVNSFSDVQNNASPTKDEVTNVSNPDAENENSVYDGQNNASPTKDVVKNDSKPDAENVNSISDPQNSASPTEDEATNRDNSGQREDGVSEKQNTDNTKSEDYVDSSKPNPENNRVMPTNYEASIKDSFETQGDNAQVETIDNNSSEETKAGMPNQDSSSDAQNNSEVSVTEKTEAMNPQDNGDKNSGMTSNEENAKENKIPDPETETKSDTEDSISSQTAHGDANSEMKDGGEIESQSSNDNDLATAANSNAETMQGDGSSASSSSLPEVSQAAKLKTQRATQKNRKKQRRHKQKD